MATKIQNEQVADSPALVHSTFQKINYVSNRTNTRNYVFILETLASRPLFLH